MHIAFKELSLNEVADNLVIRFCCVVYVFM